MRTDANIYRKIWKDAFGDIPKDKNGRSYDIHHIDGDHSNNDISNLRAVSIIDHYEIHKSQGDWAACQAISLRLNISPEERSKISRETQLKLVSEKRHHFSGGNFVKQQISEGKNALVGGKIQSKTNSERVKNGTHQFLKKNREENKDGFVRKKDSWYHDEVMYCWENIKTGERVHMIRKDFIKTYKVNSGNVYSMIRKGTYKSVGGWRVLK